MTSKMDELASGVPASQDASFNLIDEPWIPVLDFEGVEREVSLREVILSAHNYRDITGDLPTTRFALMRIILSVVYRVLDREIVDDPEFAWADLWEAERLPSAEFEGYFEKWHHRFDLLDSVQPFMQSPELRTAKDEWKPIAFIVADADPDGALFTMRSELESLGPAEAARWLVHTHAYDYSGIKSGAIGDSRAKGGKGYPMGIGWAGWLGGTVIGGRNLRETILLNFVRGRTSGAAEDLPIWEQAVLGPAERTPAEIGVIGPVSIMTWPQRRIRLKFAGQQAISALVCNGDPLEYTQQAKTELMSGWRFSEPQSAKAKAARYMPQKLDPGRALWRGLSTLIPTVASATLPDKVRDRWRVTQSAVGASTIEWLATLVKNDVLQGTELFEISVVSIEYGTHNSSFAEISSDRLAIAAALSVADGDRGLLGLAQEAAGQAEAAVTALKRLASDLDRAAGGDGERAGDRVAANAFAAFDRSFRDWLLGVKPGIDGPEWASQWTEHVRGVVRDLGQTLAAEAPDSAWIGRPNAMTGKQQSVATAIRWFDISLHKTLGVPPERGEPAHGEELVSDAAGTEESR